MTITSIATRILAFARRVCSRLAPLPATAEPLGVAADLCCRSRRELVLQNATLRHPLGVIRLRSPRTRMGPSDRLRLLLAAALLPAGRQAILLARPETILRWHRDGYRLFWRYRCRSRIRRHLDTGTIDLIRDMTKRNRLWSAERIRGRPVAAVDVAKPIVAKSVLGGLHHDYRRAA